MIRAEPFLTVRGRLQKDGKTLNVIARRVEALRLDEREGRDGGGGAAGTTAAGPSDAELHPALPRTEEYWPHHGASRRDPPAARPPACGGRCPGAPAKRAKRSAYRYLTALRKAPPGVKSFG